MDEGRTDEQALREENVRLREELEETRRGLSRRHLLMGTAGVAGAAAGAGLIGSRQPALAASRSAASAAASRLNSDATVIRVPAGFTFFIKATGQKQGAIIGGVTQKGHEGSSLGFKYELNVASPRDPQSGLPTGRRQYKPLLVSKAWDRASVPLFAAFITNENLTQVELQFVTTTLTGVQQLLYTVKLTNASIASITQQIGDPTNIDETMEPQLETLALTFQRIKLTWADGGFEAQDDWQSPTD